MDDILGTPGRKIIFLLVFVFTFIVLGWGAAFLDKEFMKSPLEKELIWWRTNFPEHHEKGKSSDFNLKCVCDEACLECW